MYSDNETLEIEQLDQKKQMEQMEQMEQKELSDVESIIYQVTDDESSESSSESESEPYRPRVKKRKSEQKQRYSKKRRQERYSSRRRQERFSSRRKQVPNVEKMEKIIYDLLFQKLDHFIPLVNNPVRVIELGNDYINMSRKLTKINSLSHFLNEFGEDMLMFLLVTSNLSISFSKQLNQKQTYKNEKINWDKKKRTTSNIFYIMKSLCLIHNHERAFRKMENTFKNIKSVIDFGEMFQSKFLTLYLIANGNRSFMNMYDKVKNLKSII
jgi:hypothetical protein